MNTLPCLKPHDPATTDDASRRAQTQERESNDQPAFDESEEKYDTTRMACTD
jgi:hypothetical protein